MAFKKISLKVGDIVASKYNNKEVDKLEVIVEVRDESEYGSRNRAIFMTSDMERADPGSVDIEIDEEGLIQQYLPSGFYYLISR